MTYQILARKWRPKDFDSVVGQEPIVTALRNALREKRIASAYLFSGIRGVGKTSVARILAKALNCERGIENGPCNECETCLAVDSGSNLDILEIDAATHSKVEQVRELTENLRYKPVRGGYKVVVLDEVHRLSRQAFDALLKIIEEPPPHLVFIFATTELESVPATILSRCQEFNFRRVPHHALVDYLRRIAEAESITVGDKALRLVARAGEGSVRDAVALLDQLATYGSGTIADDEAGRVLGGVDSRLHHELLRAIVAGDRDAVVERVVEIEGEGWDPRHVYGEFLSYCRDALHLALGADIAHVDLPDEEATALRSLAREAGYENLLRLLHQQLQSEEAVRRSESGILAVEIAWLRGAELPRLSSIEGLLAGGPPAAEPAVPGKGADADADTEPVARRRKAAPAAPSAAPRGEATPSGAEPPGMDPSPAGPAPGGVETFLELVGRRRQVIAAHLADVESLDFTDGCLTLVMPPGDPWLEVALRRDANRQAFEACLEEAFGAGARWRVVAGADKSAPADDSERAATAELQPETATASESRSDDTLEHPTVQAALDVFGGTAETIDEASS
jgi:DNA polymerase-3 subunit gamma/tau